MKFSCPSCQAKYFVRDEEVRGRTFKLRCHDCHGDIPIQGRRRSDPAGPLSSDRLRLSLPLELSAARAVAGVIESAPLSLVPSSSAPPVSSSSAPPVSSSGPLSTRAPLSTGAPLSRPSGPPPLPAELETGEYFIGVAGAATGPLDREELAARALRGDIGPRTYVWHPGLSAWQRLARVPELESVLRCLEAPPRASSGAPPRLVTIAAPPRRPAPSEGASLLVGLVISLALGVALGALL